MAGGTTTPNTPSNSGHHTSTLTAPPSVAVLRVSTPFLPSEEESRLKVKWQQGHISSLPAPLPPLPSGSSLYLESCLAVVIADVLVGTTEKQDARAALLLGGSSDHTGQQEREGQAMAGTHVVCRVQESLTHKLTPLQCIPKLGRIM